MIRAPQAGSVCRTTAQVQQLNPCHLNTCLWGLHHNQRQAASLSSTSSSSINITSSSSKRSLSFTCPVSRGSRLVAHSSSAGSSGEEGWTWKSPDWRALQRKGRAAGVAAVPSHTQSAPVLPTTCLAALCCAGSPIPFLTSILGSSLVHNPVNVCSRAHKHFLVHSTT